MPHALYVCLQDDNKIAAFGMDSDTGQLSPRAEGPVAGGPSGRPVGPDRQVPSRDNPGPNVIMQFRFDAETGRLSPNSPFRVEPPEPLGPRHYCHHPSLDIVYFSNEQGGSVTVYRLARATGTLSAIDTIATLPQRFATRNTSSPLTRIP